VLLRKFFHDKRKADEIQSVIANLNHLLNTRKGFGFWVEKFGLGDYSEYRARSKIVQTLVRELKENIELFEPRVSIESIEEIEAGSPFRLRFQMNGRFLDDERPLFIVVDSLRNNVTIEGG
jgi:predicted component of type VI protein secretion system